MPYFITDQSATCAGWAVVKADGEPVGCHKDKQSAIEQMVALSVVEGIEPGGTYTESNRDTRDDRAGVIVDIDNTLIRRGELNQAVVAYVESFDDTEVIIITARSESQRLETEEELVGFDYDLLIMKGNDAESTVDFKKNEAEKLMQVMNVMVAIDDDPRNLAAFRSIGITAIHPDDVPTVMPDEDDSDDDEMRQVNLTPPAYMRAAARQGLKYYEQGLGGDGLVDRTIREARAMAAGNVTADKWVRIRAWIARHLVDLDAPDAQPGAEGYPSKGVVAHLLWGSGPSKRSAQRALDYAEGVVSRIEAENEGRAKGEALSKIETRTNATEFEIREEADGMRFSGYAAVFDSPSEPLPFIEKIERGAFRRSLRSRNDVKFLWNHDAGEILGSTRAKTLTLVEDERGLKVEGVLPNTSRGRDVAELLRRGDVDSMSFGFSVIKDAWSQDGNERTLKSVRLHEVSLVAWPAYTATSGTVAVRGLEKIAERANVDADDLADALLKIEDGQTISAEEKEMLSRVIGELAPEPTEEPKPDMSILQLKKKKLELLSKGLI